MEIEIFAFKSVHIAALSSWSQESGHSDTHHLSLKSALYLQWSGLKNISHNANLLSSDLKYF